MVWLFIISCILIIYSFLRIKKTDRKLNGILWIFIAIVVFMSYNSIIFYLLSVLNISATLVVRSICNFIIGLILLIFIKKKQKYYFDKKDLIMIIILLYLSLVLFLYRYGVDFNIKFEMDDAAVHFGLSKYLALNNTLNDNNIGNVIYNLPKNWLFFSYINCGTLMQLLLPITGSLAMYKSFILFEMFSFLLGSILLYFITKGKEVSIFNFILSLVIIILYELGYPLTNLLYGFHYWGMVIIVIEVLILTVLELDINKMYDSKAIIITLLLLSLAVFTTYYLYVPALYMALGLYYIYLWKFKKQISFKKMAIYITITLIIPFIFGLFYYNIIQEYFSKASDALNMGIEGTNYRNLLGNFIFVLPLVIYGMIKEFKNRKVNVVTILTILSFIYVGVLFILCMKGIMSNYYYGKIYNLLWLMVFIYIIKMLYEDKELLSKVYIFAYIVISILACFRVEDLLNKNNSSISTNTIISNLGDVYDNNIKILLDSPTHIDKNIYELLLYVHEHEDEFKNERGEIHFAVPYFKRIWISQILDIVPCNNYTKNVNFSEDVWMTNVLKVNQIADIDRSDDIEYFVWFINNTDDMDIEKYDMVYKNKAGYVLKKK